MWHGKHYHECNYWNDIKHGLEKECHADIKLYKCKYIHGKRTKYKSFYPNGSPKMVINYLKGRYHGEQIEYRKNGSIRRRRMYKRGYRVPKN
jgi:antitoxin component YwqK of YwqJK toxin-antitoxin module